MQGSTRLWLWYKIIHTFQTLNSNKRREIVDKHFHFPRCHVPKPPHLRADTTKHSPDVCHCSRLPASHDARRPPPPDADYWMNTNSLHPQRLAARRSSPIAAKAIQGERNGFCNEPCMKLNNRKKKHTMGFEGNPASLNHNVRWSAYKLWLKDKVIECLTPRRDWKSSTAGITMMLCNIDRKNSLHRR